MRNFFTRHRTRRSTGRSLGRISFGLKGSFENAARNFLSDLASRQLPLLRLGIPPVSAALCAPERNRILASHAQPDPVKSLTKRNSPTTWKVATRGQRNLLTTLGISSRRAIRAGFGRSAAPRQLARSGREGKHRARVLDSKAAQLPKYRVIRRQASLSSW